MLGLGTPVPVAGLFISFAPGWPFTGGHIYSEKVREPRLFLAQLLMKLAEIARDLMPYIYVECFEQTNPLYL